MALSDDDLEFERVLGRGAFGSAYLVRRKSTQDLLVVKEVAIWDMPVKEATGAVMEIEHMRAVDHINIVRFEDAYLRGAKLMIAMELADGGDLAGVITSQMELPPEDGADHPPYLDRDYCIDLFLQMMLSLHHVHRRGYIHRDIKPGNVFLTASGLVKLGDFGVAIKCAPGATVKEMIGTPYYLAPEICDNEPYDQKADIWSMGVLLYEMLALRRPFEGSSLPALIMKIVVGNFKPLPADHPCPELVDICHAMMSLEPDSRPSAADILCAPILKEYFDPLVARLRKISLETAPEIDPLHVKSFADDGDDALNYNIVHMPGFQALWEQYNRKEIGAVEVISRASQVVAPLYDKIKAARDASMPTM